MPNPTQRPRRLRRTATWRRAARAIRARKRAVPGLQVRADLARWRAEGGE